MKWPSSTYVVSKVALAPYWREHQRRLRICSSWIRDGDESTINFREAWLRYLGEAATSTHCLVRADFGELKGGLFEIGAALGGGARVLIVGEIHQMRTLSHHPNVLFFPNAKVAEEFLIVDQEQRVGKSAGTEFLDANLPDWRKMLS